MLLDANLVLCGFMGCGKSTVGKLLAGRLQTAFIDMDEYLETLVGITIPEMFGRFGECGFRDKEHEAVLKLSQMRGVVIAAGGGALLSRRNVSPLRESGSILFLKADFDECYNRIAASDRPLVRANTREQLEQLFRLREEQYRMASDFELSASGDPEQIAEAAVSLLGLC